MDEGQKTWATSPLPSMKAVASSNPTQKPSAFTLARTESHGQSEPHSCTDVNVYCSVCPVPNETPLWSARTDALCLREGSSEPR
jgi:hypothetical protein